MGTVLAIVVAGCSRGEALGEWMSEAGYSARTDAGVADGEYGPEGGNNGGGGGEAGVITAAEWNDLDNWQFWGGLMNGEYSKMNTYWGLSTQKRIAVKTVTSDGKPAKRVPVKLMNGNDIIWETVTDNAGVANLWLGVEDIQSTVKAEDCSVSIAGAVQEGAPKMWAWDKEEAEVNIYTVSKPEESNVVDIAFIVDATGSMTDEIAFLKKDLQDILTQASKADTDKTIYTGTVFYRDVDDIYLTRTSPFTSNITETIEYIGEQRADGGGDLPEAVHTALEVSLSGLQWHSSAYSKMAFLILDAPAHVDHQGVIASLQKSVREFAARGIKLIPVFCSSGDKTCEFMCRQFAILTGGTYVFLTNDSGVGEEHVQASVGKYQVEHLNALMLRLITKYIS